MADDTETLDFNGGAVLEADLGTEMRESFLAYSMSVIVARALPDVRDGLKPVHRRILYAMNESGIFPNRPHKKSAWTVGEVIGKYHPHGDSAVYDAMVRLAQDFSMSLPLVDGHGNFGSVDGDPPAAMRYTEARLSKAAMEMLRDLDKEVVDFQPNYDESLQEPEVLPSRFPNLLVNGSQGIAVGMATNIPPHNLGEAVDATCMLIDNPDATVDELMTVMPGPDFPTGALIMGKKGIKDMYNTGRGSLTLRSKCHIEEKKNGRQRIVVTEIPYMVNKARLVKTIADLVRDKKIKGISDLRDESDRKGMRIVIDIKRTDEANVVLNQLYKATQLQTTFGAIMLALVDGVPRTLTLREILRDYIDYQVEIITRRTQYDLRKAEERAHILRGLVIALDNIDEVIHIIRNSRDDKEAKQRLMERFGLSERQSDAILQMRLRRLTGIERDKIVAELAEIEKKIEEYHQILADDRLKLDIIKKELLEIKDKYNHKRRTKIGAAVGEVAIDDLISDEQMVVTITHAGYVKRIPSATYRSQKRGGKGMAGVNLRDQDFVEQIFVASTLDYILFFSSTGKAYRLRVHELPEGGRHARGTYIGNLLKFERNETIAAVISGKDYAEDDYLMFATKNGMAKKTMIKEYNRSKRDGIIAIKLKEDDELIAVKHVTAGDKIMMVSSAGKAILFSEDEVRPMGRDTSGVKGMTVPADAEVLDMEVAPEGSQLLVVTENGYGKRTPIDEYAEHHRGGQGVTTIAMTKKKGKLACMKIVTPETDLMLITQEGVIIRTKADTISELGRATQGVKVMNVEKGDRVTAIAEVEEHKKREAKSEVPTLDPNQQALFEEERAREQEEADAALDAAESEALAEEPEDEEDDIFDDLEGDDDAVDEGYDDGEPEVIEVDEDDDEE